MNVDERACANIYLFVADYFAADYLAAHHSQLHSFLARISEVRVYVPDGMAAARGGETWT